MCFFMSGSVKYSQNINGDVKKVARIFCTSLGIVKNCVKVLHKSKTGENLTSLDFSKQLVPAVSKQRSYLPMTFKRSRFAKICKFTILNVAG